MGPSCDFFASSPVRKSERRSLSSSPQAKKPSSDESSEPERRSLSSVGSSEEEEIRRVDWSGLEANVDDHPAKKAKKPSGGKDHGREEEAQKKCGSPKKPETSPSPPKKCRRHRHPNHRAYCARAQKPIEESLRSWELEEHFVVSAEGRLGCPVCKAHSPEEKLHLRRSLQRHLRGNKHMAALKASEECTQPADVPTDAQMYFVYDIVKRDPGAGGAPQYVERCRDARAAGELTKVPSFRCSAYVFHQCVHSIAAALKTDIFGRLLSKKNPVKFMCWTEGACKQFEQMMVRAVFEDRSEENILMAWLWHAGKSTSHEKAQAIDEAQKKFSQDAHFVDAVGSIFKKHCKAFVADGAYSEPVAAQLVEVREVLPLRYAGRCLKHAKQRNLETSVDSDPELEELLDLLVREYSGGDVWMGGLCRALKNRDRHRGNFSGNIEAELKNVQVALQALGEEWTGPQKMLTGKHSVSSVPPCFDSLLTALRSIVLNFRAVIVFLVTLQGPWATRLLKKLQNGEAHVLLAALGEYLEIVSTYVHKDEGHQASKSSLLTAAGDFLSLCEDLDSMFTGDEENPPRCTSADYSRGYYQVLKKSLASHGEDFGYRDEDSEPLFCWQQQSPEEEAMDIANAMKKMQHVMVVFKEACKADLEMALGAAQPSNSNAHAIL